MNFIWRWNKPKWIPTGQSCSTTLTQSVPYARNTRKNSIKSRKMPSLWNQVFTVFVLKKQNTCLLCKPFDLIWLNWSLFLRKTPANCFEPIVAIIAAFARRIPFEFNVVKNVIIRFPTSTIQYVYDLVWYVYDLAVCAEKVPWKWRLLLWNMLCTLKWMNCNYGECWTIERKNGDFKRQTRVVNDLSNLSGAITSEQCSSVRTRRAYLSKSVDCC